MAKVALLLAIKKLRQLILAEETERIGADREVSDVVQFLEIFLQDLTADDQMPSDSAREIEELVYRVEYMVENLASRSGRSFVKQFPLCSGHGAAVKKQDRSEFTKLCTTIKRLLSENVLQLSSNVNVDSSSSSWDNCCKKWKQIFVNELGGEAVGIEEEKELILRALFDKSEGYEHRFEVIPIWGPSGTGKSTLAHAIYNDPRVVQEFRKHRIIITVSESFNFKREFSSVLTRFVGSTMDYEDSTTDTLAEKIREQLEEKESRKEFRKESRSLILLEDVRSIEDWQRLRPAVGAKGSRILVTTRAKEAAEGMNQAPYVHRKRPLTDEYSLELLKRTAWPKMNPGAEIGKEVGTKGLEMVKKCEGFPGAVIELAKLVAGKDVSEWEIVLKNARSDLSQVMTPSYDELSDHLKLCFLYLGHFREDPEVEPEKLCHLWTIESLISSQECGRTMTLLDLTEENLKVLAQKGMIDVEKRIELKSCRVVGLMGDMCLSKAEERDLLKVMDLRTEDNPPSFYFSRTRSLVIYLGKYKSQVNPQYRNLRSLRIIETNEHQRLEELVWPPVLSDVKQLRALRILDFDRIDFRERGRELPEGIFALPLLRYLSFKGCFLEVLPSSISSLSHLQVLDLRIHDLCKIIIPNVLRKMRRLQHLYLPKTFQMIIKGEKLRLDGLTELQTLKNFTSKVCEIADLFKLTKLRYLDVKVEGNLDDLKSITGPMETAPERWSHSSIEIKKFDCYTEKRHKVFRQLMESGIPPKFSFEGHLYQLPPYNLISERFTEMVLINTQLCEDPMATLEKLPNLRLLVLKDDAFLVKEIICSAEGFPQLELLELSGLFVLEKCRAGDKAMPRLSHLNIENCEKVELLPDGSEFHPIFKDFLSRNNP
ncbi:putative disease resistance protein At1g59780 [Nicotiana tabacum]|uniref:Disease resistance protein At1g59780 n=2 Tax=Nicotiana tabacum TaxID=4097 RepID=A0AC58SLZ1_TOBAC|nr:probable disease resistance protein RF9 [Nicotiana tomentosiformis]XP_016448708.1 PREDICTED: probable disease resistance protein RF9 [Nicotiana tabacum]